ncbi:tetratricopeptide repeat protein [Streptomyces sp. NPDC004609]|uniref:tetratricopeptide repeat protein n=1 Tax=Streptomyces sp. NPDC004609 TaxID=3364704 RepID=UPI0036B863C3
MGRYIRRRAPEEVLRALQQPDAERPVVVVRGVSGLGKSLLLRHTRATASCPVRLIDLDEIVRRHPVAELAEHLSGALAGSLASGSRFGPWLLWRYRRALGAGRGRRRAGVRIVLRAGRGGSVSHNVTTVHSHREPADPEALVTGLLRIARRTRGRTRLVMIDACEWLRYLETPVAEDRSRGADVAAWFTGEVLPALLRAAPRLRFVLASGEELPVDRALSTEVPLRAWHARETLAFLETCGLGSPEVAEAVHRSCRGVPVWVAAVADEASRRGTSSPLTAEWILERSRTAPVEQWLPREFESRLPDGYRDILRAAAVLRDVRTGAVRAVTGSARLPRGWERRLLGHSFIRGYRHPQGGRRFVLHPLLRVALLASLRESDPAGLVTAHRRAAGYCADAGLFLEECYHRFATGDDATAGRWEAGLREAYEAERWDVALRYTDAVLADETVSAVTESLPRLVAVATEISGLIAWHQERHTRAYRHLGRALRMLGEHEHEHEHEHERAGEGDGDGEGDRPHDGPDPAGRADRGTGAGRNPSTGLRERLLLPLARSADALQYYGEAVALYAELAAAAGASGGEPEKSLAADLARTAEYSGDLPLARETYERLLPLAEQAGDPAEQAAVWNGLGRVRLNTGSPARAVEAHRRALALVDALGEPGVEAAAWRGIAQAEHATGDVAAAEAGYRRALALGIEAGEADLQAEAWNGLGHVAFDRGAFDTAMDAHRSALDLSRSIGDEHGEAEAWCGIAATFRERSSPAEGEDPAIRALELYEGVGDRRGQASALCVLGRITSDLGRWQEAERAYLAAVDAAEGSADSECVAEAWYGLGHTAHAAGRRGEAEDNYLRALERFEALGNPGWQSDVLNVLGHVWRDGGDLDRAGDAYRRATVLGAQGGYLAGEVLGLVGQGRVAALLGELDDAERLFHAAIDRCGDGEYVMGQIDAWAWLGNIAFDRGRARESEAAFRRVLELSAHCGPEQKVRALLGLADVAWLDRDWDRAVRLATESLGIGRELELAGELRIDALLCLAAVALRLDHLEAALGHAGEARELAAGLDDARLAARTALVLGLAQTAARNTQTGLALLADSCASARDCGDRGLRAEALLALATAQSEAGLAMEARGTAELIDIDVLHDPRSVAQAGRLRSRESIENEGEVEA